MNPEAGTMISQRAAAQVFMTNITVLFWKNRLEVQFNTSNYNFTSYSIELWNIPEEDQACLVTNGDLVYKGSADGNERITKTYITGPFDSGLYCVRVTPYKTIEGGNCRSGCRTEWAMISINSTDGAECENWDVNLILEPSLHQAPLSLKARFHIKPEYQNCFSFVNVSLWYGARDLCDSLSGFLNDSIDANVTSEEMGTMVEFKNLTPGRYCVRLITNHPRCGGYCHPCYSGVIEIPGLPPPPPTLPPTKPSVISHGPIWLYVVLVSLTVALLLGYAIHRRRCKRNINRLATSIGEIGLLEKSLEQKVEDARKKKELVLVASYDFDEHNELIKSFYRLLKHLFGFHKVRLDMKEEDDILVDPAAWVNEVTCPKANRCFIIVESEGTVIQEEARKKLKAVSHVDEDHLHLLLPRVLEMLKVDIKSLCDYQNFFVVRFPHTPSQHVSLENFVPSRRFNLPDHLFELFWSLLGIEDKALMSSSHLLSGFKEKMEKKWKESSYWKELQMHVGKAEEMVRNDPDIVRKAFTEINT